MAECCKLAFFQTAKTSGREIRFKGINCYVTGSEQATGALLMLELDRITSLVKTDETPCRITDVYGWTLNNARAAADRIATDAGIAVYLPEFFQEGDHAPFPADGWFMIKRMVDRYLLMPKASRTCEVGHRGLHEAQSSYKF